MINRPKLLTPKIMAQLLVFIVIVPLLPLLISWHWHWWEAWVYALIAIGGFVISRALAARRHADLLEERGRMLDHPDAKAWDKLLSPLVGLGGGLIPLTAGLDARFGPSADFSLPIELAALVVILAGYALGSYALMENRFFSGMVRIQTDRGHRVVSSGPYTWVRHPGYAGALLTYLATPLLLDSVWAFLPVVLLLIVLVVRTRLEDQTLQAELPGYSEYARRVRYRLLPGIW
jgi:protein-S-isoprenylcysteine O-methyltransferase Ste14